MKIAVPLRIKRHVAAVKHCTCYLQFDINVAGKDSTQQQEVEVAAELETSADAVPRHASTIPAAPALDPSCMAWLKKSMEALCPPQSDALRGNAASAVEFVAERFADEEHRTAFEDFLRQDGAKPLFISLSLQGTLHMSAVAPKPGSFAAFMYLLRPAAQQIVPWSAQNLANLVQVSFLRRHSGMCSL